MVDESQAGSYTYKGMWGSRRSRSTGEITHVYGPLLERRGDTGAYMGQYYLDVNCIPCGAKKWPPG